MERRVVIHSFHSQVYETLYEIDEEADIIVALDSHLDVFWGIKDIIESMPIQIRLAAGRASAHTLIRRVFGDLPIMLKIEGIPTDFLAEMILVAPRISLINHVMQNIAPYTTPVHMPNPLKGFLSYLTNVLGIKVFTSPPKNLLKLADMMRKAEFAVLDLDVDYLQEFQTECYTPLEYAKPGQLGWTARTLKLLRKTKPPIITISEAKITAIKEGKSNFSKLTNRLKNLGYKIEYKLAFDNDREAERLIRIYKEFDEGIQKPLERKHKIGQGPQSSEAFTRYHKELKEAAKRYFRRIKQSKS